MGSEQNGDVGGVSKLVALIACASMTLLYVGMLYSPTLILRLPPPNSYQSYMIRRFVCAAVSTLVSLIFCALILPIRSWEAAFGAYGIRLDNILQAVAFSVGLTSLMYTGSFLLKSLIILNRWRERRDHGRCLSFHSINYIVQYLISSMCSVTSNISTWRNYVIAPLTEELVFRACMIPLLLCGGFNTYTVILICPILFSLAHLNHFMEFYSERDYSLVKASMAVGLQLGYTVIFGSYASFLFIRTGHLIAPLAAHVFCNMMGLPVIFSRKTGLITMASFAGMAGFLWFLFPITSPNLYNDRTNDCKCWHRFCTWL